MSVLVALIVPCFAAYMLIRACDRGAPQTASTVGLHFGLAVGLGLGLSSCSCFLGLWGFGRLGYAFFALETLGFIGLSLIGLFSTRLRPIQSGADSPSDLPQSQSLSVGRWNGVLSATLLLSVLLAATGVTGLYVAEPYGEWDAWSIWNVRARSLLLAGEHWRQAFDCAVHPDYPLLVPATSVRLWAYSGADNTWTPALAGSLFTFATAGILLFGLCRLRNVSMALLAGMALMGNVAYLTRGASQYADVPLGFFMLATVLLFALHDAQEQPSLGLLGLAGMTAGLAAWTKNEGQMFLVVVALTRIVIGWKQGGASAVMRQTAVFLAGSAPAILVLGLFKMSVLVGNDLVTGQDWHATLSRLSDGSRYLFVLERLVHYLFRVGKAYIVILPLAWLLLGGARDRSGKVLPGIVVILSMMLAGYLMVYVVTPHDLAWHVNTSMDRLLVQLWPILLLAVFWYLADPVHLARGAAEETPACTVGGPATTRTERTRTLVPAARSRRRSMVS
ncbi:MAG: hypothetical protein ACOY3P_08950 [Planctomycetota bacterium]